MDHFWIIGIRLAGNQTDRGNDLLGFGECEIRFSVLTGDAYPCGDCWLTRKITGNPETPNLPVFGTFNRPLQLSPPVSNGSQSGSADLQIERQSFVIN